MNIKIFNHSFLSLHESKLLSLHFKDFASVFLSEDTREFIKVISCKHFVLDYLD